jgi:hypothetical protein
MAHIAAQIMTNESVYDASLGFMAQIAAQFSGYGASNEQRIGRSCVDGRLSIIVAYSHSAPWSTAVARFSAIRMIFRRERRRIFPARPVFSPRSGWSWTGVKPQALIDALCFHKNEMC